MSGEKERVDAYLDTIGRIEPDIAMIDRDAALASIAISLRRLAYVAEITAPVMIDDEARRSEPVWSRLLTWLFGWEVL